MYENVRKKVIAKYGSINRLSKEIGIANVDLYCAFKGTKPMYPKYKRRIANALDEDIKSLFGGETK